MEYQRLGLWGLLKPSDLILLLVSGWKKKKSLFMHDAGYEHSLIHKTLFTQIIISIKHFYFCAHFVHAMKHDTFLAVLI